VKALKDSRILPDRKINYAQSEGGALRHGLIIMVLVDTSVWIQHFREGCTGLSDLLNESDVACHPFIVSELACGYLKNRTEILSLLNALPMLPLVDPEEYFKFIDAHRLFGKGLGFVDIHVLASARLTSTWLWTFDNALATIAAQFKIGYRQT
jgi:predicted nucleic acid-binding protein